MTTFNAINNALPELTINGTTTINAIINDSTQATAATTNVSTAFAMKTYVDNQVVSAGAWSKIGSAAVASNSATISFTGLTSAYMMYMITVDRALPVSDAVAFACRVSTDNGSTYYNTNEYSYANMIAFASDGSYNAKGGTGGSMILIGAIEAAYDIGNAANRGITGQYFIHNPSATSYGRTTGLFSYSTAAGLQRECSHAARIDVAADIDAIQFLFSTGNISSGIFTLYGLKA